MARRGSGHGAWEATRPRREARNRSSAAIKALDRRLLRRAAAAGKRERLRDGEAIDDAGRTLARACSVLFDDTIAEPLRDAVFAAVARERLAAAVTAIGQLTRSPDDRGRELVTRSYASVRRYLPLMPLNTPRDAPAA